MKKDVAIYARVSTTDKGQDIDLQLRDLRKHVEARGWQTFKEYVDNGISGTKDRRPSLDELMNDAKKKRFDAVLVWRFDRFARSTKHLVTALEEFRHLGIDFISFQENIDTSSPMGKAMFTIVSAIAELEVDILKERVIAGIKNAQAKGKHCGRPPLDPELTDRIIQLRREGASYGLIGKSLGLSKATVYTVCKSLKNGV